MVDSRGGESGKHGRDGVSSERFLQHASELAVPVRYENLLLFGVFG